MTNPTAYPITERSRARRLHKRVSHLAADVQAVLDAAPIAHIGYTIDGEPYVTPTIHWRDGDRIYWHGSAASRFLESIDGARVCLTVSLMDGYVLARSAFDHSVNYRSAMVFGTAHALTEPADIEAALRDFTEGLFPGRWATLRPMTAQELKATAVLYMDIEEATAKTRAAPPGDAEMGEYPVWAGVLPLHTGFAAPIPAPDLTPGTPLPDSLAELVASGRLR